MRSASWANMLLKVPGSGFDFGELMTRSPYTFAALLLSVVVVQLQCQSPDHEKLIDQALSAAPAGIAVGATVSMHQGGQWIELRHGNNGWTCTPAGKGDPPPEPACFDANGMAFLEAMAAGRSPDPAKPGYAYMLQGGSAWSNLDPDATRLAPGQMDYIHIPPHFMIMGAKLADASGLPLHEAHPDTSRPFVMFGGTRYAILIIPVK
jgi:hypothetical protein